MQSAWIRWSLGTALVASAAKACNDGSDGSFQHRSPSAGIPKRDHVSVASSTEATLWQKFMTRFYSQNASTVDVPLPMDKLTCNLRACKAAPYKPVVMVSCGSFNPPTIMHLRMFELAKDHLTEGGYDVLGGYLSPVNDAYGKSGLATAEHRVAMAKAAVATSPLVMVDAWEAAQPGYQRSLVVLQRVQTILRDAFSPTADDSSSAQPVRVMLLCGADLVESFAKPGVWKPEQLEAILHDHGVICISRGGNRPASLPEQFRDSITFIEEPVANDISSSKLRQLLAEGKSIKYLTPDAVIDYISQHRLYAP